MSDVAQGAYDPVGWAWRAFEHAFDAWQKTTSRRVPVVYGWLEAHACAGHALLIHGDGGSLRAGFDGTGLPHFQVATWPDGPPLQREPACAADYQPYGPVELSFVNGLIAEVAFDVLLGEATGTAHRLWVGPRKRLVQAGGGWSAAWRADRAFREEGGFIFERPWPAAAIAALGKAQAA